MNFDEFKKQMYKLSLNFNKKMDNQDYLIYYDFLKDKDIEFLEKKVNYIILTYDRFPTVRDLRLDPSEKIRRPR